MRKVYKIGMAVWSIAAIMAPIAAVVSCGSDNSRNLNTVTQKSVKGVQLKSEEQIDENTAKNTTISVAVRASDVTRYQDLAKKFNEYNKGKVEVKTLPELHMIETLQQKEASASLPELFLVDMKTMGEIVEKSVFVKPVLLSEIMEAKNKDMYNVEANEPSYTLKDFNTSQVAFSSNKNGVQYAIPLGYSSTALMLDTTMVDSTKHIYSYVPINVSDSTTSAEEKITGTKKLVDKNGSSIDEGLATIKNIQRYIDEAGNSKNKPVPKQNWLGWGVGNLFQRIYSVARSTMREPGQSVAMTWKELYKYFPLWATAHSKGILKNNILKPEDFINTYYVNGKASDELAKYFWDAFGGYTYINKNIGGFINSDAINGTNNAGEVEPFMNKQQMFMVNAKWALRMANDGWSNYDLKLPHTFNPENKKFTYEDGKGISSGQIKVMSMPYSPVSVADAMAISHTSSPAQSLVAKRFIKFLFDSNKNIKISYKRNANSKTIVIGSPAEIVSSYFSSANNLIVKKQKEKDVGQEGWYDAGKVHFKENNNWKEKSADVYRGLSGTAWELTLGNFFTLVEQQIRPQLQEYYGMGKQLKTKWTYKQFKTYIDKAMSNFVDQYNLG